MYKNQSLLDLFKQSFQQNATYIASAPGRIEFIGNHTDYNGGLVLGAAIDKRIDAAIAPREDRFIQLRSGTRDHVVRVGLDEVTPQQGENRWANYVLGVLWSMREAGLAVSSGFDLIIQSSLPVGAGLSSSAALELATAKALSALFGGSFDNSRLVHLCRRAENEFVGVPCGILDQGVSAYGKKDHLVRIDCKALTFETVPIPGNTAFWIFNSHQKHSLITSLYATRHQECMDAADALGRKYDGIQFLTELSPAQVEAGRDLLTENQYKRALHVVSEHARVNEMTRALHDGDLDQAGALLFASHESSQVLFENSTIELDFLVAELKKTPDVFGARLTGGGFGGAVMALTNETFDEEAAARVAESYRKTFGSEPSILQCHTADGAEVSAARS